MIKEFTIYGEDHIPKKVDTNSILEYHEYIILMSENYKEFSLLMWDDPRGEHVSSEERFVSEYSKIINRVKNVKNNKLYVSDICSYDWLAKFSVEYKLNVNIPKIILRTERKEEIGRDIIDERYADIFKKNNIQ